MLVINIKAYEYKKLLKRGWIEKRALAETNFCKWSLQFSSGRFMSSKCAEVIWNICNQAIIGLFQTVVGPIYKGVCLYCCGASENFPQFSHFWNNFWLCVIHDHPPFLEPVEFASKHPQVICRSFQVIIVTRFSNGFFAPESLGEAKLLVLDYERN